MPGLGRGWLYIRIVANVIIGALQIILAILRFAVTVAKAILEVAQAGLNWLVAAVTSVIGATDAVDEDGRVNIAGFYKWLWELTMLRVHYMSLSGTFSLKKLSYESITDVTLFGWSFVIRIYFSLDFKAGGRLRLHSLAD